MDLSNLTSEKINQSNNDIKHYMKTYAYLTMKILEHEDKIRQCKSQLNWCDSDKKHLRMKIKDYESQIKKSKETIWEFLDDTFWNDDNRNKIIIDFMQGDHFCAKEVRRLTAIENERASYIYNKKRELNLT